VLVRLGVSQGGIAKIESACLIGLAKVFHLGHSSEQDDVLLKIHNWNEEGCEWSLVATSSLNLTVMSLPRGQTLLDTSITMFSLVHSLRLKMAGVSLTLPKGTL
jgi:hypothetical protein